MKTIWIYADEGDARAAYLIDDENRVVPSIDQASAVRFRFGVFNNKAPFDLTGYTTFRFELRPDQEEAVNLMQLTAAAADTDEITYSGFKSRTAYNLELDATDTETNILITSGQEQRKVWAILTATNGDGDEVTLGKGWFYIMRDNNIASDPPVDNPAVPYVLGQVIDDLTTGGTTDALSAEQGKALKALIDKKTITEETTRARTLSENDSATIINATNEGGCKITAPDALSVGTNAKVYASKDSTIKANDSAKLNGVTEGYAVLLGGHEPATIESLVADEWKVSGVVTDVSLAQSDVETFASTSGATNYKLTDDLAKYLESQSLLSLSRWFPMKNSWYAGSGSTVQGVGGLTSNNISLAGTYDQLPGGILCRAEARMLVDITGLQSQNHLTVIMLVRDSQESEAGAGEFSYRWSWGDPAADTGLGLSDGVTGSLSGEKLILYPELNGVTYRMGSTAPDWNQGELKTEAVKFSTSGTQLLINATLQTVDLTFGGINTATDTSPSAANYTNDDTLHIASRFGGVDQNGFYGCIVGVLVINAALTGAQHSAIDAILRPTISMSDRIVFWGDSLTETKHLGYTNSAATVRITPPAVRYSAAYDRDCIGFGVSGETAAQIATRATASSTWNDAVTVIWAGTNDEDDTDEAGVVDEIESIVNHIGHTRFVVVTPLIKASWTATQITNVTNIRTEIISRFPDNYLDAWAVANTTSGTPDSGYLRFQSAATEDDLHPNDLWYDDFISDLKTFIDGKGW